MATAYPGGLRKRGGLLDYEDTIQATPRNAFFGGVADLLGQAYKLPEMPRLGVPGLDFVAANRNRLMDLLGVGDVQKTAEAMAYGNRLGTGRGMTYQPLPETMGAAMAVAPFAGKAIRATEGLPVGASIKLVDDVAPQAEAMRLAQQRALTAGQSPNVETRMLQQGFQPDWYHGTTGDITNFKTGLLGEATGAPSARKAFFFARDPQNPPASMMVKSTDQSSIDMLKKMGMSDEEIARLNAVSMEGHGAETASGYAQIGGSREYRDAMRKANLAEKRKDWNSYEENMQIAEDSEIKGMNERQTLVAKYGDARDTMLDSIQNSIFSKKLPQAEAEALDAKVKQLMPYGWYNSYSQPQIDALKEKFINLVGQKSAAPALKQIDNFKSIRAERELIERTQQGGNVMPVALRYKNPLVYDFQGQGYRDQSYADLLDQALAGGNDAVIMKNTYDPGGSAAKLIDVGAVFKPEQVRSRFAAYDPLRVTAATAAAAGLAPPDLLAAETPEELKRRQMRGLLAP